MKHILEKISSGRWIMVVGFTITACIGFLTGKLSGEAFLPIVILIAEWYFKRDDRQKEGESK